MTYTPGKSGRTLAFARVRWLYHSSRSTPSQLDNCFLRCSCTLILSRAWMQLQLDIVIAKFSHITALAAADTVETYNSICQDSFDSSTQLTKASNPSAMVSGKGCDPGQPWTVSTLFGTIQYSKRCCLFFRRLRMNEIDETEEREEIVAQYRAPTWLMNRAWEVQVSKATSGWTFRPRTFNVLPRWSPIFMYARGGRIEYIQELFQEKESSIYDCDENGWTLLHVRHIAHTPKRFIRG